jgi:hypothetical protein
MYGERDKRIVADLEFDRLMPKPTGKVEVIKRHAQLEDTLAFLPDAVKRVAWQVEKIAPRLKGITLEETCRNIWHRFYTRIRYRKDEPGKEQIQSPRYTWWMREGDCDDFTVLISACLYKLGIRHVFRIMAQTVENGFQHIYPVVISPDGSEIIIDCVLPKFNYEVPYVKKIDQEMELQFLDGLDEEYFVTGNNIDAEDLLNGDLGELGKKLKDMKIIKKVTKAAQNVKDKVKEGLHKVNKVNPATALLRAGILASLKLNVFNVAGALRYTYLNEAQANQKGIKPQKYGRLKGIREKLEKIFYGAGGDTANFKKAILEGKGNSNKEVPLTGIGTAYRNYTEATELPQLLGAAMYREELMCAKAVGELAAEPATTSAALAAATTAMAAIAALIKQLGPLKEGREAEAAAAAQPGSADTQATENTEQVNIDNTATPTAGDDNKGESQGTTASATDKDQNQPATKPNSRSDSDSTDQSLIDKAKAWVKENKKTTIGIASATLAAAILIGGISYVRSKKKEKSKQSGLSGIKPGKGRHKIKIKRLR